MKIKTVDVDTYRLPLPEPVEAAAAGLMTGFDMVMVTIRSAEGAVGRGYTAVHQNQGPAIASIIQNVFVDLLIDKDAGLIEKLWMNMWKAHHYAGRGAPLSFSIAAVDVALWDLKGVVLGDPLWKLLGGYDSHVKAYAGNIDLNFPIEKMLEGASASLAIGHRSVKMRLGKPTLAEDVKRVEAMRNHLPDDIELMADANEAWRVDQAANALEALRPYRLVWVEEPITPDDFIGFSHLRALGKIPIATGENLHTVAEFVQLIGQGGVDFPEPDFTTCGGITPFMKIARLAEANNLPVISHGAHDIHVHLLAACPNAAYLEVHAFGLEDYIENPMKIEKGFAEAPNRPGHGMKFDWEKLSQYKL